MLMQDLEADYQSGLDAYTAGDYPLALDQWLKVATSPPDTINPAIYAETCYAIAMLFWIGQGVPQDTAVSAGWLEKAADLNHVPAQTKLGFLYSSGQGVPQSDYQALKYFQMAANQGDPDAQYNLGVLYREGLGVEASGTEAMKWFREAAANGDVESARIVQQYEAGETVAAQNPVPTEEPMPIDADEVESPASSAPAVPPEPVVIENPVATEAAASESDATDPAASETINVPMAEEAAAVNPGDLGADWIANRNPDHYTIQIIALRRKENLHAFIDQHPDWAPFAIYSPQQQDKPLYVLVQGDYADVTQAQKAAQEFPTDIQSRDKLWIRRFVMVQEILP